MHYSLLETHKNHHPAIDKIERACYSCAMKHYLRYRKSTSDVCNENDVTFVTYRVANKLANMERGGDTGKNQYSEWQSANWPIGKISQPEAANTGYMTRTKPWGSQGFVDRSDSPVPADDIFIIPPPQQHTYHPRPERLLAVGVNDGTQLDLGAALVAAINYYEEA